MDCGTVKVRVLDGYIESQLVVPSDVDFQFLPSIGSESIKVSSALTTICFIGTALRSQIAAKRIWQRILPSRKESSTSKEPALFASLPQVNKLHAPSINDIVEPMAKRQKKAVQRR